MNLIDMLMNGDLAGAFAWIIAVAIALDVHEFAHAWVAWQAGDPTPKAQGRVTLNPLAHYDPIGTTMILLFGMGWGKPVMINSLNFRSPRRDDALVSAAGAAANLSVALLFGLALRFLPIPPQYLHLGLLIVMLNVTLAIFNLVPVYPLDGSHVLVNVLPARQALRARLFYARYGVMTLVAFLLALSFIPPLQMAFWGIIDGIVSVFTGLRF